MPKRTLIIMSLALTLVVALPPLQTVSSMLMTEAEMAMMSTPTGNYQEKRGNAFVRVLKAPFKAIGRLFGRGGRKDDNKLHRLSEKDVKKFETSPVTRLVNTESIPTATNVAPSAPLAETLSQAVEDRKSLALEHLERGRQLFHSGNVNDAITTLSTATSFDPKLKEAHNLLGVAYGTKGMRSLALGSFEKALEGDDDNPEHLNNLGYFLYQIGELEDATKYLKKAVKKTPTNERFWNNLGLVQAQRGKFDDASKSFVKAMGEFDGRLNLAIRLQRLGHDKEAIKSLEQARKLRPNSQETLSRLITLYERIGKDEEAMEMRISLLSLKATAKAPAE